MKNLIVDAFIFYNEIDMLNFRLNELYDVVDYFILVESTHTHSFKPKPLYYKENIDKYFSKFKDKIIHIVVDDMTSKTDPWKNEKHQRTCINRGIKLLKLNPSDIIIISDMDEIPDPSLLKSLKYKSINNVRHTLLMDFYYYNFNCLKNTKWWQAKLVNFKTYNDLYKENPEFIRDSWNTYHEKHKDIKTVDINNAGYHLSYFGDVNFIVNKISNFAHQEYNKDKYKEKKKIQHAITSCIDLFDRNDESQKYIPIELNKRLPKNYKLLYK